MRPYNIEGNSLQEDEIQQFNHFGQSKHLSQTQKSENTSTFQKLTNEVKTCSQKGILIIILFIIVSLVFYKIIVKSDQSDNVYGEIMFTQDQIGQMIKNSLSKDSDTARDGDKDSSIQQLAKTHNITTTQIQNAIRFSQIVPNIGKKEQKSMQKLLDLQYNYLQQKYRIKESLSAQISFCVLFPSIEQNLNGQSIQIAHSILAQNYKNYKMVLTGSYSDSSQKSLSNYLKKSNLSDDKINFIVNAGQNILKNIYFGIRQHCNLGQVVILASQPASLIGVNVLSLLNSFYQENRASLIYTQYLKVDFKTLTVELGDAKNVSQLIKNPKKLRKVEFANQFPFVSFFSDVFYSVPLSSLTIQTQKFYSDTWETALFRSLFEVAGQKTLYLNEITYIVDQHKVDSVNQKSIHYIKEIEQLQKEEQIKKSSISIDSQKSLKQIKKQQIDQDLKKDIYEEKEDQSKQNNEKESKQIQIHERQEPNAQLKEASLENLESNERDPLVSPAVVKLKQQKQEGAQHSQIVEKIIQSEHRPQKSQASQISKQVKKSTQILPIDQFGFVQDVDDEDVVDIVTPKKDTVNQNIKKISIIAGRMDVKGPNYTFNVSFQEMINNSDVQTIFGKRKSKEGIWRNQFTEAIQKLQITNNVKYGGQIEIQLTKFDYDKFQKQKRVQQLINNQTVYLEQNYKISQYKKKQLPFCIVVPSYNNVETGLYLRNLNSIFMQNYSNYHIVYIDDASKDKTGEYVKSYIISRNIPMQKIQIITNKQTRKPPYNIYNAITNHCKLGELALVVQGDDALIGTNVLNLYNAIYQRDKCAMTYSGYLDIFDNSRAELGVAHQILDQYFQKNQIRKITQIPGKYLLSFYVDVFKSIKTEEFKDPKGYFFWFSYDRALITPLLQISYPRISIVKQILYEHRRDTDKRQSINDWNRESSQILAKKAYKPLKFFPFIERNKYKYFFDEPIDKVIQNSDFDVYTFANNFESEGISKDMHVRSIKLTQLIHNVKFGGQVVVQLTDFQSSKQQKQQRILKLLEDDKNYYNEKYEIDTYRKDELPFCILTPSYNNVKSGLYLRNLDSIFMQDYSNYHVVYIDDASPDHTGEYVQKYLQAKNIPKHLIEVIINKQNKKALANIHLGIHKYCKSGQIVAIIDGDDSFIGRNVLALFNAIYQRDKAAMAYSNFLTIHNNDRTELGFCHDINKEMFEQNTFRNSWDLPGTHLMTFYSDLFKKIKISDLTYANGTFYDYAYDRAILTPLLQMAYPRISVIKEITYEYRNDTGINDSPDDWIRVSHVILDKKPYSHLIQFPFIKGLIVSTDKFNFKAQIQTVIKNTNFTAYEQEQNKKIKGIAKQQHIHAIRLTELVHNINFRGEVDISLKSNKNADKKKERLEKLLKSDKQYLQTKYEISKYKSKQLPFCIVVSSYSSVQNGLYLRNLDSILMQDYKSYRVVYINDNSPDQAHQYIKKYLQEKQIPAHVLKMILNEQTRHELSNIYYAAHNQCKLNEIMLVVGGNDALIGRNVLNVLNALYQKQKAKVGYSCFLKVYNISTQLGKCEDIDQFYFKTKTFRNKLQFENYRLMSFYTHFFRRIKIRDLTFENGTFFNNAIDKAIMTPLIQMAYPDILVAKEIMYEDRHDKEADDLTLQGTQINIILSKDPYQKLSEKQFQVI